VPVEAVWWQAGLPRPEVRRLLWHGGIAWVGMDRGGLARVDAEGRVTAVGNGELPGQALPSDAIWSLAAAGPDTLVLATSGGVAQLQMPSGQVRTLAQTPALPSDDVIAMAPAPEARRRTPVSDQAERPRSAGERGLSTAESAQSRRTRRFRATGALPLRALGRFGSMNG
jgi:hypothetical protein